MEYKIGWETESIGSDYLKVAFFMFNIFLMLILTINLSIIPAYASSIKIEHNGMTENLTDRECMGCHWDAYSKQTFNSSIHQEKPLTSDMASMNTISTNNYTAILTFGQTPYQVGPFFLGGYNIGVNGWSWIEEKKNLILLSILDNTTGSIKPVQGLSSLGVNVIYPRLTILNPTDPLSSASTLQYNQYVQEVDLNEDISHPGTYTGYFKYNSSYYESQYSGTYVVNLDTTINGEHITGSTTFDTTIYGCQSCHNKNYTGVETSFVHPERGGLLSCAYQCHTGSRGLSKDGFMGPPMNANPIHVHEMKFGHQGGFLLKMSYPQPPYDVPSHVTEVSCVECHSSFIHDNTGSDTARIGNYTLYGTNITFSSGTHRGLTCEQCHGNLNYPAIPQDQFSITNKLGNNSRSFTSSESFTDTYAIDVYMNDYLTIDVHANDGSTKFVAVYVVGPIDNTITAIQGPNISDPNHPEGKPYYINQSLSTPINVNVDSPYTGTWLVKLYSIQEGVVDYTITSNYPIERKPTIKIPECNECHNSGATGKTYAKDPIPNWNPGFAHADVNGDGTLDVQCRMCHDAMHNIVIKNCQNCHIEVPVKHPVIEPSFSQYSTAQCLECHGSPHDITRATNCKGCHSLGDVNISLFGGHSKINASGGEENVTNDDCLTCHYQKDMNKSNVYMCEACHSNDSGIVSIANTSLIMSDLMHGNTTCKTCHAPSGYHQHGAAGPLGLVEKIFKRILMP